MSDPSDSGDKPQFDIGGLPIDLTKIKGPASVPGIFTPFLPMVGFIAVSWSEFEQRLDVLLNALIAQNASLCRNWEFFTFKKRKELCRKEMQAALKDLPQAHAFLDELLRDAAAFHWKRNLILHGKLSTCPGPNGYRLHAAGKHNGRLVRLDLTLDQLDDLQHTAAHLSGRMALLVKPKPPLIGAPHFPLSEISALQGILAKGRKSVPMLPIPQPPPRSSRA